jgi:hypothetical protein
MGIEAGTAMLISSAIGAGTAAYSSERQKSIADEQQRKLADEAEKQRLEAERIARDTAPEQERAGAITFGTDTTDELGNVDEFLVPRLNTQLGGTSKRTGLGF